MKSNLTGIFISVAIGALSMVLAPHIPMVNAIVVALVVGILISNVISIPKTWDKGINFSAKTLLEIAIIFLGFGMNFQDIAVLGWEMVGILIATILIVLVATYYLSHVFKCNDSTGYLVGFGTAICGSAAIAALAPKISKNKNDAGVSIAVVNLIGLVGMLLFPIVFSNNQYYEQAALIIGGTLHGVSNVAGAGYAIDEVIGDLALTIKLGRVALLAPALIFFNFLINGRTSWIDNLKLPYYIVGFIATTSLVTFVQIPIEILEFLRWLGKALLAISMAAIGLNIKFNQLYATGKRAMGLGVVIFLIQIVIVAGLAFAFIS